MPQMPFIAVGVLSLYAFSVLPERWRFAWVPLLLIPPFLFRETGSLLVIPMVLIAMHAGRLGRLGSSLTAGVGAVGSLSLAAHRRAF